MAKGDEIIISGLLEFAEKNHIKNRHSTGLGAIDIVSDEGPNDDANQFCLPYGVAQLLGESFNWR